MEKPVKKEIFGFIAVAVLVVFAWLCRSFDIMQPGIGNLIRSIIYPALYIIWGFTLHRRLIHPQVRHYAVSLAAFQVIWFLIRTIKYSIPEQFPNQIRYMWYMYYIPMLFVPLLALLTALSIGLPEKKRLSRKYGMLWFVAAVLFLFVITNDLHQLVFRFPDNGTVWTDHDYSYGVVYYVIAGYMLLCSMATLFMLVLKSRHPKTRRWVMLPCIPIILMICYWGLYVIHTGWLRYLFGDMTAVICVLYAAAFELSIRCGMIRCNTGYGELFRAGRLGTQITDSGHKVCLAGSDALKLSKEQIISAEKQPIFIHEKYLLKSKPIRFGHVLWQEDVAELMEAIEETEENFRDLAERNSIIREKLEAEKTLLVLQEKNRVEDILHRETEGQIERIDSLLNRYDSEKTEKKRRMLLSGAAVVGAYIKRYSNLLLICEKYETGVMADLIRCFEESFLNLELLEVNCLCSLPAETVLKTKDMLRIYHAFEAILEDCLFDLHHIWVNGNERDGQIQVNIEFVCDTKLSRHASAADSFSEDSGTSRFTFRIRKGGA